MRQLAYIMFITNNHASFHLWQKENWQLIKNIMSMIVVVSINSSGTAVSSLH